MDKILELHKKIFKFAATFALGLFFLSIPVQAAVPKLMTYQGILKDSSGNYLTGTYSIVFRLYSASSGGSALWTETQSSVAADAGKFSVQLGSVTTLSLDFNADYWLSVQVGADSEMTPRVRLTSMGYGIRSEYDNNSFSQMSHDAMDHKNIEGVKDNTAFIAKTNFKLDAYSTAVANSLGDLSLDTFSDASGINSGASSGYTWRGSSNYDVIVTSSGGSVIQSSTTEDDIVEVLSNVSGSVNGFGEKFRHTSGVTIDKVAFKILRLGSPTGNIKIRLYSDSSGVPGSQLAETNNIAVSGLSTSYTEVEGTFTTPYAISANTDYHVVVENITGSGDGANHINMKRAGSGNPYAAGVAVQKGSGGWTVFGDNYDAYFKVYEQAGGGSSATVISNANTVGSAPASAMVIADETLGTGSIVYSVSRNNGTNWTTCTKETVTDISGQPSGTQVKWKAVISGDAELNAIAVAV